MRIALNKLICLACLFVSQSSWAAIAFDASGEGFSTSAATTLSTGAFTVAGSDRVLIACVLTGAGTPVEPTAGAVKWGGSGGVAMTQIGSTINLGINAKLSMWRLLNPNTGSSTVHVTWGSNQDERLVIAASYTGVDVSGTPFGTSVTANGTGAGPITVDATSAAGEFVVDCAGFLDTGGTSRTITVGASQNTRNEIDGADTAAEALGLSDEPGAATTTMSWTISAGIDAWGALAVPLKPAGVGGGSIVPIISLHRIDRGFGPHKSAQLGGLLH